MRDHISIQRASELHQFIRNEVISLITEVEKNMPEDECIRISCGYRSPEDQTKLYAQGRTIPGTKKVTNAKAGYSIHQYYLAFDVVHMKAGKLIWEPYMPLVKALENAGYEWGGRWKFKDQPHFQKTFSYTVKQLLQLTKDGKFIPGTNYLDIVK